MVRNPSSSLGLWRGDDVGLRWNHAMEGPECEPLQLGSCETAGFLKSLLELRARCRLEAGLQAST
jgi:hypothetical protein